jgi:hypothetical protein
MTHVSSNVRLPFLLDWNICFAFCVSFPSLFSLTVTDQYTLSSSLRQIQVDGVLVLPHSDSEGLCHKWRRLFSRINTFSYIAGSIIGLSLAVLNYVVYSPISVKFWAFPNEHFAAISGVFLYCIFLFYFVISIYVIRSIGMTLLLKAIVARAPRLHMLPFHPDHCGGLRSVGQLGLRNQYGLTIFGMNLVLLIVISTHYLGLQPGLYGLITAAAIAYMLFGPLVFTGPLLPFRAGMVRMKSDLMSEVARRLRIELARLRVQLASGTITKEDEELIDRLRKVGAVIDELPVWPFDTATLRTFVTAYVVPVASAVAYPVCRALLKELTRRFQG